MRRNSYFFRHLGSLCFIVALNLCLQSYSFAICLLVPQKLPTLDTVQVEIRLNESDEGRKCWLGVDCQPISPIIQSQLSIDSGLAVLDLADRSPAEKAGLKQFDILLRLDSQPLINGTQLSGLIDECGEQEVFLEVLRGGRLMRLRIRPEPKPVCQTVPVILVARPDGNFDLNDARTEIAEIINSRDCGDSLQKFQLIFVHSSQVYLAERNRMAERTHSSDELAFGDQVSRWPTTFIGSRDSSESCDKVVWIRLQSDLKKNALALAEIENRISIEQRRFEQFFSDIRLQQATTKRLLEWQLQQVADNYDPTLINEIGQQRRDIEEALFIWEQMSKRMRCYGRSLRSDSSKSAEYSGSKSGGVDRSTKGPQDRDE